MVSSSSREVVFLLKTQLDGSIGSGFNEVARRAVDAQSKIDKSLQATADKAKVLVSQQSQIDKARYQQAVEINKSLTAEENQRIKNNSQAWATYYKLQESEIRKQTKLTTDQAREHERLVKQKTQQAIETNKSLTAEENQRIKNNSQQWAAYFAQHESGAKRQQATETQAKNATLEYHRALERLAIGRESLYLAATRLARGTALLLAGGNKDAQKLLQHLVMIQGVYDVMQGSVRIVRSLTTAYDAYIKSVEAATAAEAAHAAVAGGSNVAASGSWLGRGLSAGARGLSYIGGGSAGMGAAILGIPAVVAAVIYYMSTSGAKAQAALSDEKTLIAQNAFLRRTKMESLGEEESGGISGFRLQRSRNESDLRKTLLDIEMQARSRALDLQGPDIGRFTANWTGGPISRPGQIQPGNAQFAALNAMIEGVQTARAASVNPLQQRQVDLADKLTKKQSELADTEKRLADARMQSSRASAIVRAHQMELAELNQTGLFGTVNAGIRDVAKRNLMASRPGYIPTAGDPELRDEMIRLSKRRDALTANLDVEQRNADAIQKRVGEELSNQKTIKQQILDIEQEQTDVATAKGQLEIQNAEAVVRLRESQLDILKRTKQEAIEAAEAVEKSARSAMLTAVTDKSDKHARFRKAMERHAAGKATVEDYAILAGEAMTDTKRREYEEAGISRMTPAQRKRAEEEAKARGVDISVSGGYRDLAKSLTGQIKTADDLLQDAKKAAMLASNNMATAVSKLVTAMFDTMDKQVTDAIDKAITKLRKNEVMNAINNNIQDKVASQ